MSTQKTKPLDPILFLGGGNMSSAIIGGLLGSKTYNKDDIFCIEPMAQQLDKLSTKYDLPKGTQLFPNFTSLIMHQQREKKIKPLSNIKYIFLGVKPGVVPSVLAELDTYLDKEQHVIISIAAGVTIGNMIKSIRSHGTFPVIRAMPNTPAMVSAGITGVARGPGVSDQALDVVANRILASVGKTLILDESLINPLTGVSGSGPAYVLAFVEALADGGVKTGLSYPVAYELAVETVFGTMKLLKETGDHPAKLRQQVTSPGGTTIHGLVMLKEQGFDNAVIKCVEAACERGEQLGAKL